LEAAYVRLWSLLHVNETSGVSAHERDILHHISGGLINLTDLAGHLGLPKSSASVLVKRLHQQGLVHRDRDPTDERRLQLRLTAEGQRVIDAGEILDRRRLERALRRMGTSGEELIGLLIRLADTLERQGPGVRAVQQVGMGHGRFADSMERRQ
jgi:DNA-binding MarR family transcriptional regulator